MCGICGFNWADKNLLIRMIDVLKHRGPDDSGLFLSKNISIGHTRLSIIDLSKRGKQPIHNEDNSIWITFNGEIYNYKEIKKDLIERGHKFYTRTDTEVIIHAYEEFGFNCLKIFNGQFAFCIYDSIKNILFLARDRLGIKPLYYYYKDKKFIFASEIKAILKHNIKKDINKTALVEYFNYRYTIAPNTLFKGIKKLKSSNYMIFDLNTGKIKISNYYELNELINKNTDSKNISDKLLNLLIKSIKLRMRADVPVGCFLSGGIDSSIITGLASKFNRNINTFSVGFETSSETAYAKIVSDYFNTNHHELIIKESDVLPNIERMVYHMDEPIGDPGFFPTFLISELASKYNKVVLAGEGADEIFGGYDKYKMFFYGKKFSKFVPNLNYNNIIINRISNYSKLNEKDGYLETIRVFNSEDLKQLNIDSYLFSKYWIEKGDLFQKMQYFDLKTLMPEDFFMKADKMSSAFGLEERVPYMDHNVVEFVLNLPIKLKLNVWNEKFILKNTFKNFLPKEIVKRRKRGYDVPIDDWFKHLLDSKLLEIYEENNHNLYKKQFIEELLRKIKNLGNNYKRNFYIAQQLWTIYMFEEWYNLNFLE